MILALGAISSLTEDVGSSAGGSSSTTTAATTTATSSNGVNSDGSLTVDENLTVYFESRDFSVSNYTRLAFYQSGVCEDSVSGEESDRIYMGCVNNASTNEAMICFAFSGLEVGKTYFIGLSDIGLSFDYSDLYYRFGNYVDFDSFPVTTMTDLVILFTAKTTEFQLGCVYFPEMPSSDTLNVYGEDLKAGLVLSLNEVGE